MTDGYEQEDMDVIFNNKSISTSSLSSEEIYNLLGCEQLDE